MFSEQADTPLSVGDEVTRHRSPRIPSRMEGTAEPTSKQPRNGDGAERSTARPFYKATPLQSPENVKAADLAFRNALLAAIPPLRAYARMLAGKADVADDLVQETLIKAWAAQARFAQGSSMRAWTHVILRNLYFSQYRQARYAGVQIEIDAVNQIPAPAGQDSCVALADLARALAQLPERHREAVILIGAGGLTCEEAAAICNCPPGTMKSWLSRGRTALRTLMENGQLAQPRSKRPVTDISALDQIMHEAQILSDPGRSASSLQIATG